jgi:hypothetical protein
MASGDDTASRVEEILAKVDREVARRTGAPPPAADEPPPPPAPAPTPAAPTPPDAATEVAPPPAPEPEAGQPHLPDAAGDVPVPTSISIPGAGREPGEVEAPVSTPAELASGIAAARRRLAIINAQVDDLAAHVAQLAAQTPRGAFGLPDALIRTSPDDIVLPAGPDLSTAGPIAPAPEPEPVEEPVLELVTEPEPEPEPEPVAPPVVPRRASGAGMSVRPRPPAQHQRTMSPGDQARLVAVELAVAGRTRGEVEEVLREDRGLEAPAAMLDSLFGAGSGPDTRMIGT